MVIPSSCQACFSDGVTVGSAGGGQQVPSNRLFIMTLKVRLASITSNSGDNIELSSSGVTCLVGSNNAGKSRTLSDISGLVETPGAATIVVIDLQLDKPQQISLEEATGFLEETGVRQPKYGVEHTQYVPLGGQGQPMRPESFAHEIVHAGSALGATKGFFFQHWQAGQMSHNAATSLGHVPGSASPSSPLHRLFLDGELEEALSKISYEAFEHHLTVDRANMDVRLRVGTVTGVEIPPLNRPTLEYANAVAALPSVMDQGDGVKSFLGIVMTVLAGQSQILLIDEPEAYLHPGQARALGRWLSLHAAERDLQVIVATHSREFILGLVGGEPSHIRMVRIVREGEANRFHVLPPEDISAAWEDPVLRYSNVLQGLFHRRVVVCESDADCRFYGAVLDELAIETNRRSQADDILLVPSGGKDRMAALAKSMLKLGVETHALGDFDVLNKKDRVRALVEATGGVWTDEMNLDYVTFARPVQSGGRWDELKRLGVDAVPAGAPYSACVRLLNALDESNIHIVPIGEMEAFDHSLVVHGSVGSVQR
jgi:ABC-type cobalamin/Fe3+-siderophores transport system ATPase subunit